MSNPNKQKGTDWENKVRDYLNRFDLWGTEVIRSPQWGQHDRGDLFGTGQFCFEAKAHRQIKLAQFIDEAIAETVEAGVQFPIVVQKRRQHTIERAYAVMEFQDLVKLIQLIPEEYR